MVEGLVQASDAPGGAEAFVLTDRGHKMLQAGTRLMDPFLAVQDLRNPAVEMSHWQVIKCLERDGWDMPRH